VIGRCLTPKFVRAALVTTAVVAFVYRIGRQTAWRDLLGNWSFAFLVGATVAHVIASILAVKLVQEFPKGSRMRLAWVLIAASNLGGLVRHVFECVVIRAGYWRHPVFGLRQIPLVLALVLLLAGLVVMWSAFSSLGLGLRVYKRDIVALAALMLVVPPALIFERHEMDLDSPFAVVRILNLISPFFFAATAGLGLLLYRLSVQLGEGQLARSLRYLALFPAARLLLSVLTIFPDEVLGVPYLRPFLFALTYTVSWFLALAMAERWQLTLDAARQMKKYR
jgi:hypothetical protein